MRILITNDDGITAPGLKVLSRIATQLAGASGDVWTVAPQTEQSGVGRCVSYTKPILLHKYGVQRFAVEGTPADCVLVGLHDVMPHPPDLILSGVNRGNNSAENTLYSGTIGAAIEGALAGIPAIALSQYFGPENNALDDPFESAAQFAVQTINMCLKAGFHRQNGYMSFYNVNFPPVSAGNTRGIRAAAQGYRKDGIFRTDAHIAPNGRRFLYLCGSSQQEPTAKGSDAAENLAGFVSITPMRADLTAVAELDALNSLLD